VLKLGKRLKKLENMPEFREMEEHVCISKFCQNMHFQN
jgi:hypothetical protein